MHPMDEAPATKRENDWPGFLFPSQVASFMLVETEDLMPLIAPIVWPIFGSMMALRYPAQLLRVAATASVHSILHFVNFEDNQQIPKVSQVVRTFVNLRPPTAYTMIKDKQQVEYNYTATIRARTRCALPLAQEFHPVEWLHMPISPRTGAIASFAGWNEKEILKTLKTVVQRLGGRDYGQEPSGLRHFYVCDTSRMYAERTEPRPNTDSILQATTCLSRPEVVDQKAHQQFQKVRDSMQLIA